MRIAVEKLQIEHEFTTGGTLTASFGVAEEDLRSPDCKAVIERADAALYKAKQNGRNQVCAAPAVDDLQKTA